MNEAEKKEFDEWYRKHVDVDLCWLFTFEGWQAALEHRDKQADAVNDQLLEALEKIVSSVPELRESGFFVEHCGMDGEDFLGIEHIDPIGVVLYMEELARKAIAAAKAAKGDLVAMVQHDNENCIGWNPEVNPLEIEDGTKLYTHPQPVVQGEPVAWVWKYANGEEDIVFVPPRHVDATHVDAPSTIVPLYTQPAPMVRLTDDEILAAVRPLYTNSKVAEMGSEDDLQTAKLVMDAMQAKAAISKTETTTLPAQDLVELMDAATEVLRISDRNHEAWSRLRAALAKHRGES